MVLRRWARVLKPDPEIRRLLRHPWSWMALGLLLFGHFLLDADAFNHAPLGIGAVGFTFLAEAAFAAGHTTVNGVSERYAAWTLVGSFLIVPAVLAIHGSNGLLLSFTACWFSLWIGAKDVTAADGSLFTPKEANEGAG